MVGRGGPARRRDRLVLRRRHSRGPPRRHPARLGRGTAWCISTRLSGTHLDAVLGRACDDARIAPRTGLPYDVEVVSRTGDNGTYLFAINHTGDDAKVPLDGPGTELLTGEHTVGRLAVPAGAVRVVRLDG